MFFPGKIRQIGLQRFAPMAVLFSVLDLSIFHSKRRKKKFFFLYSFFENRPAGTLFLFFNEKRSARSFRRTFLFPVMEKGSEAFFFF